MPDIRNIRTRPGVRVYLHPADLTDIMTQPDVVESLDDEQKTKIIEAMRGDTNDDR